MESVNWLEVAAKLVRCFGFCEGTAFEGEWLSFGITREQRKLIEAEVARQDEEAAGAKK